MMAVIGASLEGSRRAWQSFQGKCCDQLPSRFPDGVRFTGNSEGVIEHLPNYERVLEAATSVLPARCLLGCSAVGIIGAGAEVERSEAVALVAARLPGVELLPFHLPGAPRPGAG